MQGGVNYNGNTLLTGGINVNTTGNIQALNVQVTENGERTITPPEGVDGYAPITIDTNVPIPEPVLDILNVTSNGTYTPPSGTDGYNEITVNVPQSEPVLDDITITENGTYTPPSGTDGYDEITVNVPQSEPVLDDITITENGTYTPPSGTDGYDEITVNVPLPENAYLLEEYEDVPTDIASFTASDAPLKSLTASIVPVQAGSGDPSPTNVRPITGWTEEVITVTDDLQNPTVTHTTTIPFLDSQGNPVEVYGGSVDVVNGGEQQSTLGSVDLGDLNWTLENGIFRLNESIGAKLTADTSAVANMLCSVYKTVSQNAMGSTTTDQCIAGLNWSNGVRVKDSNYTDAASFKQAVSGQQLVYELATPTTFYTQPTSIKSLDGENNVSASTGDVEELKYFTRATHS